MPRAGGGYTFHMGKWAEGLLPYLDECARERGLERPKLIQHLMAKILSERMIDDVLGKYDPTKSPRSIVPVARSMRHYPGENAPAPRSHNLFDQVIEDVTPATSGDLPEPSRKTKFPPLPDQRSPRYVRTQSVGIPPQWNRREKTKSELREELRQAVENTR